MPTSRGLAAYRSIPIVEQDNELLSKELLAKDLRLLDMAMRLQLEAIACVDKQVLSPESSAVAILIARTFNHHLTALRLLLSGYYGESVVLLRSAFEAMTLAICLHQFPEKADDWWQGRQIQPSEVRTALEQEETLSQVYTALSKLRHPNVDVTATGTHTSLNKELMEIIIGPHFNSRTLHALFHIFLHHAMAAVMVVEMVHRNTLITKPRWYRRAARLERAIENEALPHDPEWSLVSW